jgi:hypothetical protein
MGRPDGCLYTKIRFAGTFHRETKITREKPCSDGASFPEPRGSVMMEFSEGTVLVRLHVEIGAGSVVDVADGDWLRDQRWSIGGKETV